MDLLHNIQLGLAAAVTPAGLMYCFIGVFLGMFVGVLPGIGALAAIAMLFPFTYYLEPAHALIMLAGIYYGTAYGGSTTAILLNVPGSASSAVVCYDGYPMARQGRAGVALFMVTIGSFVAGSVGILLMMAFGPLIVRVAQRINSAEYFALMVLGLIAASSISTASIMKSIAMVLLGIAFGIVGLDVYTGAARFTFGSLELTDGISLTALAMGIFGMAEIISSVDRTESGEVRRVTWKSMIPTREDLRRSWMPMARGTAVGSFFGILPGTGATLASFMSYALERRVAKDPSRFGHGAIEGVVAPESANNAADQTAFIPTMTLGIPGSATMALMLSVLLIHGINPGPLLMVDHPELFWGLIMSFWIGNLMLLILNIPLIGMWVRLLQIPYHLFFPAIMLFIVMGVYSVNNLSFDIWVLLFFGILGYALHLLRFPVAPLLLGFVLGPMMEEHFRRALLLSGGNLLTFVQRPVSGAFIAAAAVILIVSIVTSRRKTRQLS